MDFPAQQIFSWEILMQLKRTLALPRDKSNLPTNKHQQALLAYYLFLHTHLPLIFVQLKFGISVGRDSIFQCVYATSNHTRQLLPPLKWNVLRTSLEYKCTTELHSVFIMSSKHTGKCSPLRAIQSIFLLYQKDWRNGYPMPDLPWNMHCINRYSHSIK